jgi:fructosamine-3-kinase
VRSDGVVDGHQTRLVATRARTRRQDQSGRSACGHGPIVLDRAGVTRCQSDAVREDDVPGWALRLAAVVGPLGRRRPLGGTAWQVEAGERTLVAKGGRGARDEAEGLRALAAVPGAPPVPDIVLADADVLVTTAVEQAPRTAGHEEALGRDLAHLHAHPWREWGGGSSLIGACPVDAGPAPDGVTFYAVRLLGLAQRCGLTDALSPVVDRLPELLPPGGPTLVHGDLWWGNVLWGADGRAWLIDPSAHGGHPEEDLAMLALFGAVPETVRRAYAEVNPLADGWEDRVGLFQLVPLLVHTVLFGGGYRGQAEAVARRYI